MKFSDTNREMLPIWLSSDEAKYLPETNLIHKKTSKLDYTNTTQQILTEFSKSNTVGTAIELLNIATIEKDTEAAFKAAQFLSLERNLPQPLQRTINRILGLSTSDQSTSSEHSIKSLRQVINYNPNNPLAWLNISREYAIVGEKEKSRKCMLTALHLAKDHRWITRTAARAFVHYDEKDIAHSIILKSSNLKNDPWLIATEMAVARLNDKETKFWKAGKKLLDSGLDAIHKTELASSFGTLELLDGATKKAKGYFKQSLINPNKNSLAQAKWAERRNGIKNLVQVSQAQKHNAYEAQYWEAYTQKNMTAALSYAQSWLKEEPYSSGPPMAISYLAALLDDYELINSTTDKGLIANPDNTTLKLNRIFAWVATLDVGHITNKDAVSAERYIKELKDIIKDSQWYDSAHAMANIGMLSYRLGNLEQGRQRYEKAAEYFTANDSSAKIVLYVNHLREALISEATWAKDILVATQKLLTKNSSSTTPGAEFYLEKILLLEKEPGLWKQKFKNLNGGHPANSQISRKLDASDTVSIQTLDSIFWLPPEFENTYNLSSFTKVKNNKK